MDVFKNSLQTSALQLIHLSFLSTVAQIIFHSRRGFYLKCQNCRICGFHTVFIWSKAPPPLKKKRERKQFVFLLHPVLCESLKGDKACQCWSFSYAPVVGLYLTSPCHLSESGEGNDKQSKPLQSRSLSQEP